MSIIITVTTIIYCGHSIIPLSSMAVLFCLATRECPSAGQTEAEWCKLRVSTIKCCHRPSLVSTVIQFKNANVWYGSLTCFCDKNLLHICKVILYFISIKYFGDVCLFWIMLRLSNITVGPHLFLYHAVWGAWGSSWLSHRRIVSHPGPTDRIQWGAGVELSQIHTSIKQLNNVRIYQMEKENGKINKW